MTPIDFMEFQKRKWMNEANRPDQPETEHSENDNDETSDIFEMGVISDETVDKVVMIPGNQKYLKNTE